MQACLYQRARTHDHNGEIVPHCVQQLPLLRLLSAAPLPLPRPPPPLPGASLPPPPAAASAAAGSWSALGGSSWRRHSCSAGSSRSQERVRQLRIMNIVTITAGSLNTRTAARWLGAQRGRCHRRSCSAMCNASTSSAPPGRQLHTCNLQAL